MSDRELNESMLRVLQKPAMKVVLDIDDVQIPWAAPVHEECIRVGLAPKNSTWTSWTMWENYNVPNAEERWYEVVNSLVVRDGIYHAAPYPGVVEALQKLDSAGADLHHVTARGFFSNAELIREWTREWMDMYKIPGSLWFAQNKGHIADILGATHAIDDRYENVLSLMNAGVGEVYLMNQPHNQFQEFDPYRRVDSVSEFVEKVLRG